jgi:hypothetical protein
MAEFAADISVFKNLERDIKLALEAGDLFEVRRLREEMLKYFLTLRTKLDKKRSCSKINKTRYP